jgi:hypothetical protein
MALNPDAVILPGRGLPFIAAVDTAAPNYETMTPAAPGTGWEALGHTSRDNNVQLSREGGDATVQGTWWTPAFRTTYADTSWSVTVNSVQVDETTLDLAFNGAIDTDSNGYIVPSTIVAVERALFILVVDGTSRMGLYLPHVSLSIGDSPAFDPTKFFEIPLAASVLDSEELGGIMQWFHPALEAA